MIWTALTAAVGFLKRMPWQLWAALAVVIAAWVWGNHRYDAGRADERAKWEAAAAKAKARADAATVSASEQRARDTIRNHDADTARKEAINASPDDPRLGLNCQRLRAAGIDPPAACAGR